MAEQPTEFVYRDIELYKSESLGSGSYGGVCKAKCDGLPCAAKIMHPTLFDLRDPGTTSYLSKFLGECRLLSLARHPNVVQYLGTCTDHETRLPVLLMELCDESLTAFLERSPGPLSYHIQVNICNDIALALVYLHSNGLIHRDLTGNNVLMIAGIRAKITDFGMSKLASVNPRMTALTLCPGNLLYMSPEALDEAKSYTAKLDIFSFGVIVIQILTRQFPNPTDRFRTAPSGSNDEDEDSEIRRLVPETERREAHHKLIQDTHSLKPLALQCLKKKESLRPSAVQLSERLSELKQSSQYTESMLKEQNSSELEQHLLDQTILVEAKTREVEEQQTRITELESVVDDKDRELHAKDRQLHAHQHTMAGMHRQIQVKDTQLLEQQLSNRAQLLAKDTQLQEHLRTIETLERSTRAKDVQVQELRLEVGAQGKHIAANGIELEVQGVAIDTKDSQLHEHRGTIEEHERNLLGKEQVIAIKDEILERKESELQHTQEQLHTSEQLILEFQQSLEEKDTTITDLQQTISEHETKIQQLEQQDTAAGTDQPQQQQPVSAVADQVTCSEVWNRGPNAPEKMSRGAAIVIGDMACFMPVSSHKVYTYHHNVEQWSQLPDNPNENCGLAVVNGILTSVGGCSYSPTNALLSLVNDGYWSDIFPPMPTPRSHAACVATSDVLIVAGGDQNTHNVGLDTVEVMITNVAQWQWATVFPLPRRCSSLSAAILGDTVYLAGGYCSANSVFTCSIANIKLKAKQTKLRRTLTRSQWKEIRKLPVSLSTLVAFKGDLLAIGGKDDSENPTPDVYRYDPHTNIWKVFGKMEHTRLFCLAVALPLEDRLMVVGGFIDRDYAVTEKSVQFMEHHDAENDEL